MDTQNTPIHVRLWDKHFWTLAIANLLLVMSSYMLIPAIPIRLRSDGYTMPQISLVLGIFFVGMYLFGNSSAYLVQRYRRKMVFLLSTLLLLAVTAILYYLATMPNINIDYIFLVGLRFLQGSFYGLSQLVLLSTLVIDNVEAVHRTEANHAVTWFGRFALALGPIVGLTIYHSMNFGSVLLVSCCCVTLSFILVSFIRFPFRLPNEDLCRFSLDRFLLKGSLGFILALLAERFAFSNADLRSEATTGLFFMGGAVLLMLTRNQSSVTYIAPILTGFGVGIIGSRFLLFFIKLAGHCQRGTSQSTFILAWETGIGIGLVISFALLHCNRILVLWVSLTMLIISLVFYTFFVHKWYVKHKNR